MKMKRIVSLLLVSAIITSFVAGIWNSDGIYVITTTQKRDLDLTKEEKEIIPFYSKEYEKDGIDSDIIVEACETKKYKMGLVTSTKNSDWNRKMIKAPDKRHMSKRARNKVKVAILDSGVDYGNDIEVKESVNFVEDSEMSPLFIDDTGHGTSVAGIIAADDDNDGITGINTNVEIYSARVLKDNKAPVDRVVAGIEWAIEKNVNILNLSFSTHKDSKELHKAIQKAYNKGILIIAAAGNEGKVEYPAAYKEVVAVGAIKADGKISENSATGKEMELVAPGEKVKSSALLNGTVIVSGTSIAAPQVAAIASLLWEKDTSMPAEFIRELLNKSANKCGTKQECGNGLIDYEYAKKIYDEVKREYMNKKEFLAKMKMPEVESADVESVSIEDEMVSSKIEKNTTPIICFKDNNLVEGQWADHDSMAADYTDIVKFQKGAKEPDVNDGIKGLGKNMAWHGGRFTNCIAVYRYLNKVARAVNDLDKGASLAAIKNAISNVQSVEGMSWIEYNNLNSEGQAKYKQGVFKTVKSDLLTYIAPKLQGLTKRQKEAFVFGLASHTATDMYAHSSFRRYDGYWRYLKHYFTDETKKKVDIKHALCADNTKCIKRRYESAKKVLSLIVDRFNNNRSSIAIVRDFAIESPDVMGIKRKYYNTYITEYSERKPADDATYRIYKFKQKMAESGESEKKYMNMYSLASVYQTRSTDTYDKIK